MIKLNLKHINNEKITVYTFERNSFKELFYALQEKEIIENFLDDNFILYDEMKYYSDLEDYQDLTAEELGNIDFNNIIDNMSDNNLKLLISEYLRYRYICEFEEV